MVKDTVRAGWKAIGLNLHYQTNRNLLGDFGRGRGKSNYVVNLETGKGMWKIIEKTLCTEDSILKIPHISTS